MKQKYNLNEMLEEIKKDKEISNPAKKELTQEEIKVLVKQKRTLKSR